MTDHDQGAYERARAEFTRVRGCSGSWVSATYGEAATRKALQDIDDITAGGGPSA